MDWILPPRCPLTGQVVEVNGALSVEAWRALTFISSPFCSCCGFPFEIASGGDFSDAGEAKEELCGPCLAEVKPYAQARSIFAYDDASRDLILAFKHGDQIHLTETFTPLLLRVGAEMLSQADWIVPVPLHRVRLIKRRYNQAALLAKKIAENCGAVYQAAVLKRVRSTPPQGHMGTKERHDNVRGAFEVHSDFRELIVGKNIVLVDDVFTTGATLEACCRELVNSGAQNVSVLTLARVVKPH